MDIKNFSDELKLLVVDKLLFGGLVFACVFLVQSEYEQFNNERAFKIEVTKITWALTDTSISKLNTCSEQLAATILHVYQGATLSSIDRNKAYENIMCIELQSEALASHLDTNINGEETELISGLQITSSESTSLY